jgi:hypothetical protein
MLSTLVSYYYYFNVDLKGNSSRDESLSRASGSENINRRDANPKEGGGICNPPEKYYTIHTKLTDSTRS